MKVHKHIYVSGKRSAFLAPNFHSLYLSQCIYIIVCDIVMCVSNWSNHQKLCEQSPEVVLCLPLRHKVAPLVGIHSVVAQLSIYKYIN